MQSLQKQGVFQGQDWSGAMGEKWHRHSARFEGMLAPVGRAVLAHAEFRTAERVLDIGCGAGPTTLEIARAVGPNGHVLGVDVCSVLVHAARERATLAGIVNAGFVCGDAATLSLSPGGFQHLFSRFGVMFFEDPFAAFGNMRTLLRDGARLTFCCWGPPPENPWVGQLSALVARHIVLPPPDPTAPGPFAFADQERTAGILEQAGFTDIAFTPWRGRQLLGGPGMDAAGAADFAMQAFFVGEVLAEQPDTIKAAVVQEMTELFASLQQDDGVGMDAMAWLVTARTGP